MPIDSSQPTASPLGRKDVLSLKGGMLSDIWLYVRYQLLTKTVLFIVVLPLYKWLNTLLIQHSGRTSISSGDFKSFVLSPYGLIIALTTVALLTVLITTDVAAFVIAERSRLLGNPIVSARDLLKLAVRAIPRFFHPGTLILLAYTALIVPLVGFGPSLQQLSWVKIPNFVSDVINNNSLYFALYCAAIIALGVLAFFLSATFSSMFIDEVNPWIAMKRSVTFVKQYWRSVTYLTLRGLFVLVATVLSVTVFLAVLPALLGFLIPDEQIGMRFSILMSALTVAAAVSFLLFIVAPVQVRNLTRIYTVLTQAIDPNIRVFELVKQEDRVARTRLIQGALASSVGIVTLAAVSAYHFDALFKDDHDIAVIAHRAGGDLDAENSLEGMLAAAEAGAKWAEIDVQRTKDGKYVINHDGTFSRVAGVDKASTDMTLDEVKTLEIANLFTPGAPSRPVPTIEELMDAAKGKIGIFIELKGATADKQMVDDMAKLIKDRGLQDSMALLSLDYELITYAEQTYPELLTGYLYYFAVGDMTKLHGDYLIMEEGVANADTVATLQQAGKKVVVWTVNTPESIDMFAGSQVDGIITDKPREVLAGIKAKTERTDIDRIFDTVFE